MITLNPFARVKPERIEADLLYEAKRHLVEHEAHAEYHQAQAEMYRARILRLNSHPVAFAGNVGTLGNAQAANNQANAFNQWSKTA